MPASAPFHHFTPLAPGPWTPQTRFDTGRVDSNLYWLKTFSRAAYQADRQRALGSLEGVALDRVERLATAVAGRDYLLACLRELLFESVREQVDPALPSRRRCLFLADGGADLGAAARRFGFDAQGRAVLAIEPLAGSCVFRARGSLLDTSPIVADIMDAAHRYWSGAGAEGPSEDVEVLLEGPFSVRGVASHTDGAQVRVTGQTFVDVFGPAG